MTQLNFFFRTETCVFHIDKNSFFVLSKVKGLSFSANNNNNEDHKLMAKKTSADTENVALLKYA